jgi:serine/threonine protein phosphatase PrpC
MRLRAWSLSDVGRRREQNEDSLLDDGRLGLYAVADGMGGHVGGAFASKLALKVLHRVVRQASVDFVGAADKLKAQAARSFRTRRRVETERYLMAASEDVTEATEASPPSSAAESRPAAAVLALAARKASSAVYEAALRDPSLRGMGTTLTAMLHHDGRMHVVHAGDSRAYLMRDGALRQLTEDHSWIQEQVKAGAMTPREAKSSRYRNVITRSIGYERDARVDLLTLDLSPGDCFLICSDGLSNPIEEIEIQRAMASSWYRALPRALVDLANNRGGDDNITVVVVYAGNDTP